MKTAKKPDNILGFEVSIYFPDSDRLINIDESGIYQVNSTTWNRLEGYATAEFQIPEEVLLQSDRSLAVVRYIKGLFQEWENNLVNPNITGNEPRLGSKK